jgi:hypothetical protein
MAVVRAMARSEARRVFQQTHEQGMLSMATAIPLCVFGLVALLVLIALRRWVSLGGITP